MEKRDGADGTQRVSISRRRHARSTSGNRGRQVTHWRRAIPNDAGGAPEKGGTGDV